ncbi:hypothetical protein HNP12_003331 [Aeromonas hydrophila]|uniref:ABC transporter substrate-binding protein n=1 Tax=Aeromonas hydrophila TaxID=644 RepID=UPI0021676899|nr:ABC transporter substrate-binding protein [Aeromonas hydrophila]MCS3769224.1 hypothetical protein [Aeromonas hydrophila]
MKKIGLAIALGNEANSHTKTFIEAITYSLNTFPKFKHATLKIVNDHKNAQGGERAANELIKWGADVVVGHFSSIAALSALPIYTKNGVSLLLPASTACELSEYNKNCDIELFRYQHNNAELLSFCIKDCLSNSMNGLVYFIVQSNDYGNRMVAHLPMHSGINILSELNNEMPANATYVIIGYSDFASNIIKKLTIKKIHRIMLIDDSDCADVYENIIEFPFRLSRIQSKSLLNVHNRDIPYWNETILALALACEISRNEASFEPCERIFNTYAGMQKFNRGLLFFNSTLISEDVTF